MPDPDVRYGGVTVLGSAERGRHPSGNSLRSAGRRARCWWTPHWRCTAVRSPEVLLAGSGMRPDEAGDLAAQLRDTFHLTGRRDVGTVADGDVLDRHGLVVPTGDGYLAT